MSKMAGARAALYKLGFLIEHLDPEDTPTKGWAKKRRQLIQKALLMDVGSGLPAGGKIEDVDAVQE